MKVFTIKRDDIIQLKGDTRLYYVVKVTGTNLHLVSKAGKHVDKSTNDIANHWALQG